MINSARVPKTITHQTSLYKKIQARQHSYNYAGFFYCDNLCWLFSWCCISFDWLYNKDIFQKSNHTGIRKQHYWGHTRGKMALAYVRCSDAHYLNNILGIYVIVITITRTLWNI